MIPTPPPGSDRPWSIQINQTNQPTRPLSGGSPWDQVAEAERRVSDAEARFAEGVGPYPSPPAMMHVPASRADWEASMRQIAGRVDAMQRFLNDQSLNRRMTPPLAAGPLPRGRPTPSLLPEYPTGPMPAVQPSPAFPDWLAGGGGASSSPGGLDLGSLIDPAFGGGPRAVAPSTGLEPNYPRYGWSAGGINSAYQGALERRQNQWPGRAYNDEIPGTVYSTPGPSQASFPPLPGAPYDPTRFQVTNPPAEMPAWMRYGIWGGMTPQQAATRSAYANHPTVPLSGRMIEGPVATTGPPMGDRRTYDWGVIDSYMAQLRQGAEGAPFARYTTPPLLRGAPTTPPRLPIPGRNYASEAQRDARDPRISDDEWWARYAGLDIENRDPFRTQPLNGAGVPFMPDPNEWFRVHVSGGEGAPPQLGATAYRFRHWSPGQGYVFEYANPQGSGTFIHPTEEAMRVWMAGRTPVGEEEVNALRTPPQPDPRAEILRLQQAGDHAGAAAVFDSLVRQRAEERAWKGREEARAYLGFLRGQVAGSPGWPGTGGPRGLADFTTQPPASPLLPPPLTRRDYLSRQDTVPLTGDAFRRALTARNPYFHVPPEVDSHPGVPRYVPNRPSPEEELQALIGRPSYQRLPEPRARTFAEIMAGRWNRDDMLGLDPRSGGTLSSVGGGFLSPPGGLITIPEYMRLFRSVYDHSHLIQHATEVARYGLRHRETGEFMTVEGAQRATAGEVVTVSPAEIARQYPDWQIMGLAHSHPPIGAISVLPSLGDRVLAAELQRFGIANGFVSVESGRGIDISEGAVREHLDRELRQMGYPGLGPTPALTHPALDAFGQWRGDVARGASIAAVAPGTIDFLRQSMQAPWWNLGDYFPGITTPSPELAWPIDPSAVGAYLRRRINPSRATSFVEDAQNRANDALFGQMGDEAALTYLYEAEQESRRGWPGALGAGGTLHAVGGDALAAQIGMPGNRLLVAGDRGTDPVGAMVGALMGRLGAGAIDPRQLGIYSPTNAEADTARAQLEAAGLLVGDRTGTRVDTLAGLARHIMGVRGRGTGGRFAAGDLPLVFQGLGMGARNDREPGWSPDVFLQHDPRLEPGGYDRAFQFVPSAHGLPTTIEELLARRLDAAGFNVQGMKSLEAFRALQQQSPDSRSHVTLDMIGQWARRIQDMQRAGGPDLLQAYRQGLGLEGSSPWQTAFGFRIEDGAAHGFFTNGGADPLSDPHLLGLYTALKQGMPIDPNSDMRYARQMDWPDVFGNAAMVLSGQNYEGENVPAFGTAAAEAVPPNIAVGDIARAPAYMRGFLAALRRYTERGGGSFTAAARARVGQIPDWLRALVQPSVGGVAGDAGIHQIAALPPAPTGPVVEATPPPRIQLNPNPWASGTGPSMPPLGGVPGGVRLPPYNLRQAPDTSRDVDDYVDMDVDIGGTVYRVSQDSTGNYVFSPMTGGPQEVRGDKASANDFLNGRTANQQGRRGGRGPQAQAGSGRRGGGAAGSPPPGPPPTPPPGGPDQQGNAAWWNRMPPGTGFSAKVNDDGSLHITVTPPTPPSNVGQNQPPGLNQAIRQNANSGMSILGRQLARTGWELSFIGNFLTQFDESALQVGQMYRVAEAQQSIEAGYRPGLNQPFRTPSENALQAQLPMYSTAQIREITAGIVQGLGIRGTAALDQNLIGTGLPYNVMAAAALGGLDPNQLSFALGGITGLTGGRFGGATNAGNAMLNALLAMGGGVLNQQTAGPLLQSLQMVQPMASLWSQSPLMGAALLSIGAANGVTPAAMPSLASGIAGLYQGGFQPNAQQGLGLLQLFGGQGMFNPNVSFGRGIATPNVPMFGQIARALGSGLAVPQTAQWFQGVLGMAQNAYQLQTETAFNTPELTINASLANINAQAAQLQYALTQNQIAEQQYQFGLWKDVQEYGPIGADVSRQAYFQYEKSLAAGQYDSTHVDQEGMYAPQTPFGLQNEMFYAGVEHQRAELVLGRSKLLSDVAFQQNILYLNQQEDFYKRQLDIQNIQRADEKVWQQELLDAQRQSIEAQMGALAAQQALLQAQIPVLRYQEALLPLQLKAVQAELAGTLLQGLGYGPLGITPNGGAIQPDQIIQQLAKYDPTTVQAFLQAFLTDPASIIAVQQIVSAVQENGGIIPATLGNLSTNPYLSQLQKDLQAAMGNGAFGASDVQAAQQNDLLAIVATANEMNSLSSSLTSTYNSLRDFGGAVNTAVSALGTFSVLAGVVGPMAVGAASIVSLLALGRSFGGTVAGGIGSAASAIGGAYATGGIGGALGTIGGAVLPWLAPAAAAAYLVGSPITQGYGPLGFFGNIASAFGTGWNAAFAPNAQSQESLLIQAGGYAAKAGDALHIPLSWMQAALQAGGASPQQVSQIIGQTNSAQNASAQIQLPYVQQTYTALQGNLTQGMGNLEQSALQQALAAYAGTSGIDPQRLANIFAGAPQGQVNIDWKQLLPQYLSYLLNIDPQTIQNAVSGLKIDWTGTGNKLLADFRTLSGSQQAQAVQTDLGSLISQIVNAPGVKNTSFAAQLSGSWQQFGQNFTLNAQNISISASGVVTITPTGANPANRPGDNPAYSAGYEYLPTSPLPNPAYGAGYEYLPTSPTLTKPQSVPPSVQSAPIANTGYQIAGFDPTAIAKVFSQVDLSGFWKNFTKDIGALDLSSLWTKFEKGLGALNLGGFLGNIVNSFHQLDFGKMTTTFVGGLVGVGTGIAGNIAKDIQGINWGNTLSGLTGLLGTTGNALLAGVSQGLISIINAVIDFLNNSVIKALNNFPGIHIGNIPNLAGIVGSGVSAFSGGGGTILHMATGGIVPPGATTVMNEWGPEVVKLPSGSVVIPASQSSGLLASLGPANNTSKTVTLNIAVNGVQKGAISVQDEDRIAEVVLNALHEALK